MLAETVTAMGAGLLLAFFEVVVVMPTHRVLRKRRAAKRKLDR